MTVHTIDNAEGYQYGISRSWLDNGQIALIKTQGDMSRNAINTWATLLILTLQDWDKEKPIALLHDPRIALAEVAADCGFVDQSHFTHAFRRMHRCTPAQYRAWG